MVNQPIPLIFKNIFSLSASKPNLQGDLKLVLKLSDESNSNQFYSPGLQNRFSWNSEIALPLFLFFPLCLLDYISVKQKGQFNTATEDKRGKLTIREVKLTKECIAIELGTKTHSVTLL